MRNRRLIFSGIAIIVCVMAICYVGVVDVAQKKTKDIVVVVDAGHGGYDPGKVGISGVLEKDINLAIACKVRRILEKEGIQVVMTRKEDVDLCAEAGGSKKSTDMRKRVEIMNASGAAVAVSIHQNSFTDASSHGSQVFYYEASKEGETLAKTIQESIKGVITEENHRQAKPNREYYILKKVSCPVVIVECGFLSNQREEMLLTEEDYQEKMAQGIVKGILQYVSQEKGNILKE